MLLDLLSKSWHPIIKDTEASTKRVLYQNFDLGVGFIPLYIIDMVQVLLCKDTNEISELVEDGFFLGRAMVSGSWSGTVICPHTYIIDTSGTIDEITYEVQEAMTSSVSALGYVSTYFKINESALDVSSQSELSSVGRTYLTTSQFLNTIEWNDGYSEQKLKDLYEVT